MRNIDAFLYVRPSDRTTLERLVIHIGIRYKHSSDGVRSVSLLPERMRCIPTHAARSSIQPATTMITPGDASI